VHGSLNKFSVKKKMAAKIRKKKIQQDISLTGVTGLITQPVEEKTSSNYAAISWRYANVAEPAATDDPQECGRFKSTGINIIKSSVDRLDRSVFLVSYSLCVSLVAWQLGKLSAPESHSSGIRVRQYAVSHQRRRAHKNPENEENGRRRFELERKGPKIFMSG
jgi:hypothetical protein